MKGTDEEREKVILYKLARVGFSPEQSFELDLDLVQAFSALYDFEKQIELKRAAEVLSKMFGGK